MPKLNTIQEIALDLKLQRIVKAQRLMVNYCVLKTYDLPSMFFDFSNIRYYEVLKPVLGESVHNNKYVKIVFYKTFSDGKTDIKHDTIVILKEFIKNFETLEHRIATPMRKEK